MRFLWFALIGCVVGWVIDRTSEGTGFGVTGDIAIGAVGGVFGGLLLGVVGLAEYGIVAQSTEALIGAILLLSLAGYAGRKREA